MSSPKKFYIENKSNHPLLFSGLCWPSKKEIQEKLEYESVAFPFTIKEMMDAAAQKKREEQEVIEKREKDLAAKFAKVAIWKKELNDKLNKKVAEAQAAKVIIS